MAITCLLLWFVVLDWCGCLGVAYGAMLLMGWGISAGDGSRVWFMATLGGWAVVCRCFDTWSGD